MRIIVTSLMALLATPAAAASADVCRPYATLLVEQALMKYAWTRAYTHCLILEEDHPVPPSDWRGALDIIDPDHTPVWPLDRGNVEAIQSLGDASAAGAPDPGHDIDKCRRNFPRSWDPKTQTVILPANRHKRVPCPM